MWLLYLIAQNELSWDFNQSVSLTLILDMRYSWQGVNSSWYIHTASGREWDQCVLIYMMHKCSHWSKIETGTMICCFLLCQSRLLVLAVWICHILSDNLETEKNGVESQRKLWLVLGSSKIFFELQRNRLMMHQQRQQFSPRYPGGQQSFN